jgi:hypothetical protein
MATLAVLTASAAKAGDAADIRMIGRALTSIPDEERKRVFGDMISSPDRNK